MMSRVPDFGRILLAVSVAVSTLGCDAGDSRLRNDGPIAPACATGRACSCGQPGQLGQTTCIGSTEVCRCAESAGSGGGVGAPDGGGDASCSEVAVAPVLDFEACGGEPFGLWQATDIELGPSLDVLSIYLPRSLVTSNCDVLPGKPELPSFVLDLQDGGAARFAFGAWSFDYRWDRRCSNASVRCFGTDPTQDVACECRTVEGCAVSNCTVTTPGDYRPTASWTRSGSTISLDDGQAEFSYCVRGDRMKITWGSAVIGLKRARAAGVPTPCAARTGAECALGNRSAGGCGPVCTGGATCAEAQSEAQCTNRQGCSWDASQCGGTAPSTCEIQDYGVVPGCEISKDDDGICVGKATPCAGKDSSGCNATRGCAWGEGCTGGALHCSDAQDCASCNAAPGCRCDSLDDCVGTASFECTAIDSAAHCSGWGLLSDACNWSQATCRGEPTPCADLLPRDCANTAGCTLQPGG